MALVLAREAVGLVAKDSLDSYLAKRERRRAVERVLSLFGEALKDLPAEVLDSVDPVMDWNGPKHFRDVASHWYTEGLDHELIWRVLHDDLPRRIAAIEGFLKERPYGD